MANRRLNRALTPNMQAMRKLLSYLSLALAFLTFAAGCKGEKKEEPAAGQAQMEAVIAIHDEVMPKMGDIGKLVGQLKPLADSTETGMPYLVAMKDLQAAHQAMMDWMQGFGNRFDHEEVMEGKALSDEKLEWLKEEDTKVKAMREQVFKSIEAAEALLARQASQ